MLNGEEKQGGALAIEHAGFLPLFAVEAGREQALARIAGS